MVQDRAGDGAGAERPPRGVEQRPVMLHEPLERVPSQVEAVEGGVAAFEPGHDPERLGVVVEAAVAGEAGIERILARVAERRVAEVVGERHGLGQILVEPERAGERSGYLAHLERVGQARPEMVALVVDEDLRLVGQSPEGGGVNDAVAIALEVAAGRGCGFRDEPPSPRPWVGRVGRAPAMSRPAHHVPSRRAATRNRAEGCGAPWRAIPSQELIRQATHP